MRAIGDAVFKGLCEGFQRRQMLEGHVWPLNTMTSQQDPVFPGAAAATTIPRLLKCATALCGF